MVSLRKTREAFTPRVLSCQSRKVKALRPGFLPRFLSRLVLLAPNVDGCEQEEPDDVHKVPVPSRRLETDMAFGGEVIAGARAGSR